MATWMAHFGETAPTSAIRATTQITSINVAAAYGPRPKSTCGNSTEYSLVKSVKFASMNLFTSNGIQGRMAGVRFIFHSWRRHEKRQLSARRTRDKQVRQYLIEFVALNQNFPYRPTRDHRGQVYGQIVCEGRSLKSVLPVRDDRHKATLG